MKILIVEDDFISRTTLCRLLMKYGECDTAEDGKEGVAAFGKAIADKVPYDLVCMDIMMPEMDGQEAMKRIREIEQENHVNPGEEAKAIMVTALDDTKNVAQAFFRGQVESYITKPYDHNQVVKELSKLGLLQID